MARNPQDIMSDYDHEVPTSLGMDSLVNACGVKLMKPGSCLDMDFSRAPLGEAEQRYCTHDGAVVAMASGISCFGALMQSQFSRALFLCSLCSYILQLTDMLCFALNAPGCVMVQE